MTNSPSDITLRTTHEQGRILDNADKDDDTNELEFDDGMWMASILENPTPMTSDPAPIMPIQTIACTDEMWAVEVADPAARASIGGVLSVTEKEAVDTMGPSKGNWRDVTITSKDNLDLELTEYF